jgi:hypothetical protein
VRSGIPPELAKTGEVVQQAHDMPLSRGALAPACGFTVSSL